MRPVFSRVAVLIAASLLFLLANACPGEDADELMEKGKVFEQKFQASQALPLYLAAEKLEPKNPTILVHIARQYRYLMTDAPAKEEKLRFGHLALEYSARAAAAGPHDSDAQLATAITLGKMLPYLPAKEQIAASPKIKRSVDKALQLTRAATRRGTFWGDGIAYWQM